MMFRIAWRNLWRNRTRTIIVGSAIAMTYALFLISIGVSESMYGELESAAAQSAGGTLLVHQDGYWAEQTNEFVIEDGDDLTERLRERTNATAVSPRVVIDGLLSTAASNMPVRLTGIDPEAEREFGNVAKYLDRGTFLSGDEEAPIVLPTSVAEELDAELGDRVVLTATGPDGEMKRALFHLSGTLDVGEMGAAAGLGYTSLEAARNSIGLDGQELTQIGLLTGADRAVFKDEVIDALGERGDLEVLTWSEAIPDLVGFIEMDRAFANIYGFLVFIVVVFAITNTFLMIVMERVRELGLLNAIGLSPPRVGLLVILETIVLAAISLSIGLAIGYAGHIWIATYGIDLNAVYGGTEIELSGVSMTDMIISSKLDVERWMNASLTVFGLVVASALYPAWRASRLEPAEAMRFYG